ncbi:MAG TPA: hypothetical protein VGP58_11430 [Pyrinomonadaceae bacterium]|nr:hypothetical protein [Pyrinomonadaceae bacterium]
MGLIESTKSFVELFLSLVNQKEKRDEKYDNALIAVTTAVNKTRSYLRYLEKNPHDTAKEERLAELWSDASIKLRRIDNDLAFDCHQKSYYWSNPDGNTKQKVRKLDDIHKDCLTLLAPLKNELNQDEIILLGLNNSNS